MQLSKKHRSWSWKMSATFPHKCQIIIRKFLTEFMEKKLLIHLYLYTIHHIIFITHIIIRYIYFAIKEYRLKLQVKFNIKTCRQEKKVHRIFFASLKMIHCDVKYDSLRFLFYETIFHIRQVKSKISQSYLMPIAR